MAMIPADSSDRPRLETRLQIDLLKQGYHHEWHTANPDQLRELEARIQTTARRLEPDAPQASIDAGRRKLAYGDLAQQILRRAKLPYDPSFVPEPLEARMHFLDKGILDLARERVDRVLGDLRRLEVLDTAHRHDAQTRSQLAFRGNIVELKAALERMVEPRDVLEKSAAQIYRDPKLAIRGMRKNFRSQGLRATLERFSENPAPFGKLHGVHFPGLGDSPGRSKALDFVQQSSANASAVLTRHDRMERHLDSAVTYQRLQARNRDLVHAYPTREKLLTELGRHMEGLEIHQVRPLLRTDQAKLVQDVRRAEQHFLEPLREASRSFRALDTGSAQLGAQAQKIAGLFQGAPRHIVSRLTPPQMQIVLVAAAMARRAMKVVSKVART